MGMLLYTEPSKQMWRMLGRVGMPIESIPCFIACQSSRSCVYCLLEHTGVTIMYDNEACSYVFEEPSEPLELQACMSRACSPCQVHVATEGLAWMGRVFTPCKVHILARVIRVKKSVESSTQAGSQAPDLDGPSGSSVARPWI
jgi:hypothetical protein